MESAKLKIVVHAGKDLKNVKHLSTMNPYAVVWIAGDGSESKQNTKVAQKGGTNPVWDCSMEFDVVSMQTDYVLFCQIKNNGTVRDQIIGEVQVSFAELLAGDTSGKRVRYPVKIPTGEVKGEIILSHEFSELVVTGTDTDTGTGTGTDTGTGTFTSEVIGGLGEEKNSWAIRFKQWARQAVGKLGVAAVKDWARSARSAFDETEA